MKTTTDRVSLTDLRDQLRTYKESVLANLVMAGEIPAPTFSEHRRIEFLINRFIESSVSEVSVDDAGNGIGIIKGTGGEQGNGRAILINAHADTVFSEKTDHTLMVGKETITGPAVADNGLGFAVLATLPQILSELDIRFHNDMILLGGVKSLGRGNLDGIRFFLDQSPFDIVAGLCIEGIQLGRLSYQSIGMFRGEITCRVPESYDWSRFGEASAVLTLNEIINKINDIRIPRRPRTGIVMGKIDGGSSFNTLAKEATLGFEVRSESDEVVSSIETTFRNIATEVASKTGDQIELDIFAHRKAGGIPFEHPVVTQARHAMEQLEIEPRLAPSTSELAAFIDHQIPALTLGITTGEQQHNQLESIQIEPIFRGLAQIIGTLISLDQHYKTLQHESAKLD
ncbi:MAG: M20/M25/M40 family metallo-hydrolase [Balneolaceae bacterium]